MTSFLSSKININCSYFWKISVIPAQASSHRSQGQLPSGSGPAGNSGAFAPPPYVQCNPPAPATYRLEANDRCMPQHQQRSSSQSRPMSSTSSSLGSPNHIRPISPVPTSALSAQSHQLEKKDGAAQKTSSGSKPKKCKDEVNNIQVSRMKLWFNNQVSHETLVSNPNMLFYSILFSRRLL